MISKTRIRQTDKRF